MNKMDIYVFYGGKSAEHEVSLDSACFIMNNLDKSKYNIYPVFINVNNIWSLGRKIKELILKPEEIIFESANTPAQSISDFLASVSSRGTSDAVFFPALHGTFGEDGTIQGLFEMLNIPYVGCGVLSSAAAMDKIIMKNIFDIANIPGSEYIYFTSSEWNKNSETIVNNAIEKLSLPLYIKPANLGSSIGITRATSKQELISSIKYALKFDRRIIVEKEIVGREITMSIKGNESPECSICGEWQRTSEFFDFDDKYLNEEIAPTIPANITEEEFLLIKKYGTMAYKALDCSGLVRGDFFLTQQGEVYLGELNTLPGFTSHSIYPKLWEATNGQTATELLDELVCFALERFKQKDDISYRRED